MADLEERFLENIELQSRIWWKHIDVFSWEYGDYLKQFIEKINAFHPTTKLNVEWSKEEINFLDDTVRLRKRQLETDLYIKPTDPPHFLDAIYCHP